MSSWRGTQENEKLNVIPWIDAIDGFDSLGGRALTVSLFSELDITGQPRTAPDNKHVGFMDPYCWRYQDLERKTDAGIHDRRLAVQVFNDYDGLYRDAEERQDPFPDRSDFITAKNRSTRESDGARTAIPASHRRVIDVEDGRYGIALTHRGGIGGGKAAKVGESTGRPTTGGDATSPDVSFGPNGSSVSVGGPSGSTTITGAAAAAAAQEALNRGGDAADAWRWALSANRGEDTRPAIRGGTGTKGGDGGQTQPRPAPPKCTPPGARERPFGSVWDEEGQVGWLGTMVKAAWGKILGTGRDGTPYGYLPVRHDAWHAMGTTNRGRIMFVPDEASGVPEGRGKLIKGEMWHDSSRADKDTELCGESGQWRPVIKVDARLPPGNPPPPHRDPRDGGAGVDRRRRPRTDQQDREDPFTSPDDASEESRNAVDAINAWANARRNTTAAETALQEAIERLESLPRASDFTIGEASDKKRQDIADARAAVAAARAQRDRARQEEQEKQEEAKRARDAARAAARARTEAKRTARRTIRGLRRRGRHDDAREIQEALTAGGAQAAIEKIDEINRRNADPDAGDPKPDAESDGAAGASEEAAEAAAEAAATEAEAEATRRAKYEQGLLDGSIDLEDLKDMAKERGEDTTPYDEWKRREEEKRAAADEQGAANAGGPGNQPTIPASGQIPGIGEAFGGEPPTGSSPESDTSRGGNSGGNTTTDGGSQNPDAPTTPRGGVGSAGGLSPICTNPVPNAHSNSRDFSMAPTPHVHVTRGAPVGNGTVLARGYNPVMCSDAGGVIMGTPDAHYFMETGYWPDSSGPYGASNVLNTVTEHMGAERGAQNVQDQLIMLTEKVNAMATVINAVCGGPDYYGGNLAAVSQNEHGHVLGQRWVSTGDPMTIAGRNATAAAVVQRTEGPVTVNAGAVLEIRREVTAANAAKARSPLIHLVNDRPVDGSQQGSVTADMIASEDRKYSVRSDNSIHTDTGCEIGTGTWSETLPSTGLLRLIQNSSGNFAQLSSDGTETDLTDTGAGGSGTTTFGGNGTGTTTISSNTEASGQQEYGSLTINAGVALYPAPERMLRVFCSSDLTVNGEIHASGRGGQGTGAGGAGSDGVVGSPSSAGTAGAGGTSYTILCGIASGGGSGGGSGGVGWNGISGSGTSGAGGAGSAGQNRCLDNSGAGTSGAGGTGISGNGNGNVGSAGGAGTADTRLSNALSDLLDGILPVAPYGGQAGVGGGGGSGGASATVGSTQTNGTAGGAGGTASGSNKGGGFSASSATTKASDSGGGAGGGGGGGGACGGGVITCDVLGDVTIGGSGAIEANGGTGGDGGDGGGCGGQEQGAGGGGGGGSGGGGGIVILRYAGTATGVTEGTNVTASGGAGGSGGSGGSANGQANSFAGGNGANGAAGEDGYTYVQDMNST